MVRLFSPSASPLDPWSVWDWRYFRQLPPSAAAAQQALSLYGEREARRQAAIDELRRRQDRERRAREAARRRHEGVQRALREAREKEEREAEQRERDAIRRREQRRREELRENRLRTAQERHRDAETPDDALVLTALVVTEGSRWSFVALRDPGAESQAQDRFLFCPSHPSGPFVPAPPGTGGDERIRGARAAQIVAAYRAWQVEERSHVRRAQLEQDRRRACEELLGALSVPVHASIPLAEIELQSRDVRLALTWCTEQTQTCMRTWLDRLDWDLKRLGQELDQMPGGERPKEVAVFGQMLSARLGEIAAREHYEKSDPLATAPGTEVVDMAIRQVTSPQTFDRTFDFGYSAADTQGKPDSDFSERFDVKNTRTPRRGGVYTRHYVKRLRVMGAGKPVRIVGTVTTADTLVNLLRRRNGDGEVSILGETDRTRVTALEQRYGLAQRLRLRLQQSGKLGQFYPPWMLEAPVFTLSARVAAMRRLRHAHRDCIEAGGAVDGISVHLAVSAGIALTEPQRSRLSPSQRRLVDQWTELDDSARCSLPHLYLTVLREFVDQLSDPTTAFVPSEWREIIFREDAPFKPLGAPDPLRCVDSLLVSLEHLMSGGLELLQSFTTFEFEQAGILYGYRHEQPGTRWTLMYTHCGDAATCGGKNLVLGREALCLLCGHLICRRCNFCQKSCPENQLPLAERTQTAGSR